MNDLEIAETDTIEPSDDIVVYEEPERDLRGASSDEELSKVVEDHIVNDFEKALNLIRSYQILCKRALVPDLHWQEAHDLLAKYRMESIKPIGGVVDPEYGDITTHTTSIPGSAEEIALPSDESSDLVELTEAADE